MTAQKKIIAIIILFALGGGLYWYNDHNRPQSHQFVGLVQESRDSSVFILKGVYVLDENPSQSDYSNHRLVEVRINEDTKLIKTNLYLPTEEELKKTGGRYEPGKLKREIVSGIVGDLTDEDQQIQVTIQADSNIYNKDLIKSGDIAELGYIVPIYP